MDYTSDLTQGKTYARSSVLSSSYEAANAFDNNDGTLWHSGSKGTNWISVDFGSSVKICKIVYRPEAIYVTGIILQGSQDASTWSTVYNLTGYTANTTKIFEFTNNAAYRYYRLIGTSAGYLNARTLEMYSLVPQDFYTSGVYVCPPIDATTVPNSRIGWESSEPTGTSIAVDYAVNDDDEAVPESWTPVDNGGLLTMPEVLTGKFLWIRITLATEDPQATPEISGLWLDAASGDPKKVKVYLTYAGRMKHPQGQVTLDFTGTLMGPNGGTVAAFNTSFTPENIIPWFNPNDPEAVEAVSSTINAIRTRVYYSSHNQQQEAAVEAIGATISVVRTNIDDLEN